MQKFVMLLSLILFSSVSRVAPQDCQGCSDVPLLEGISCAEMINSQANSEDFCESELIVQNGYCQCTCGRCNAITPKVSRDSELKSAQTGDLNAGSNNCDAAKRRCQEQCGGDIYSTVLQCDLNGESEVCSCDGQKLDGLFRTFGVDAAQYGKQTFADAASVSVSTSVTSSGSATAQATATATALDRIRSSANVQEIAGQCTLLVDEEIEQKLLETVNMVRGDPMAYADLYKCDATQFLDQVSSPVRGELKLDGKLIHASTNHSCWQAQFDTIDHTGKDGSSPGVRAKWQEYDWALVGETLAYNYPIDNLLEVVLAWYCSPSHRDILASCFMVEAGIGIALNGQGEPYYTIMAACPQSDVSKCTCQN